MRKGPPEREEEQTPRSWGLHVSWSALFLLGWLLYEATSQPGLAAVVTCAKFGWSDWRVAWWLRRVDPDWRRGRTCFWFYLAFGLWKVAVMALLFMLLLAMFVTSLEFRNPGGMPWARLTSILDGVMLAGGIGLGLSTLANCVSVWSALRHCVKVWLGAAPHLARTRRYWPPYSGRHNAALLVTWTSLTITIWSLLFAVAVSDIVWGPLAVSLLVASFALAFPLTMFVLKYLERRVFARKPAECWPPDELGAIYQAEE